MLHVFREFFFVRHVVRMYPVDLIVSDNRYGFFHHRKTSFFLCHQLSPAPEARVWGRLVNRLHAYYIRLFDSCLVPDTKPFPDLTGALSENLFVHNCSWIGPLSRFLPTGGNSLSPDVSTPVGVELLILLSGPEPARSRWEKMLLTKLQQQNLSVVIIGGKVLQRQCVTRGHIRYYPSLPADKLMYYMQTARQIICRAGYTTLMELLSINKTAVIVPTPGQTEQMYLANHFAEKGWFVAADEGNCIDKLPDLSAVKMSEIIRFNDFAKLSPIIV